MKFLKYFYYFKLVINRSVDFILKITNKFFLIFIEFLSVNFREWKKPVHGQDLTKKRILVIRHGGIGDLLFISSILKELKFRYPTSYIALMTRKRYHELFSNFYFIDEIINHAWPNIFKLLRYDFVIFLDKSIEIDPDAKHMNVYDLLANKYFSISIKDATKKKPVVNCISDNRQYIKTIFPFIEDGNINIGVQIRAGSPVRTPSVKFYVDILSTLIISLPYCRIFILEEKSKVQYAELVKKEIQKKVKNKVNIYNFAIYSRDINDLVAIVSFMNLIIAPDSSVMHIAAGLNIPSIGIYGPFPGELRAKYYDTAIIFDAPYKCAPCFTHGHKPCPEARRQGTINSPCFEQINKDILVKKARDIITNHSVKYGYGKDLIEEFNNFLNNSEALNQWKKVKKVYVISPARNCSTILTQYLNIHPDIKIFNEAGWDRAFEKKYTAIDRLAHFSALDQERLKILLEYYYSRDDIEFEDLLGFLCSCNPLLWKMVQSGKIIGNKDPFLHRDIADTTKLIEYLAQRGWYFIGILKTKLYQIIPSLKNLEKVHPEKEKIKNLHQEFDYYAERLIHIIKDYNLISNKRIFLRTYDDFVTKGRSIFNEFVYFLTQDHKIDFNDIPYKSIKKKIIENLSNIYLGSTNFIYRKKSGLVSHHTSILESITDKNKDIDISNYIKSKKELIQWENTLIKFTELINYINS